MAGINKQCNFYIVLDIAWQELYITYENGSRFLSAPEQGVMQKCGIKCPNCGSFAKISATI